MKSRTIKLKPQYTKLHVHHAHLVWMHISLINLTCKAGASRTLYGIRLIFRTLFFDPDLAILCDVGEGPKELREFPMGELLLLVLSCENLRALLLAELNRRTLELLLTGDEIGLLEVPVLGADAEISLFVDCKGSHSSSERMRLFIMF